MSNNPLYPVVFDVLDSDAVAFDIGSDDLLDIDLGDTVIIGRAEQTYDGQTNVIPMLNTLQTLETKDKLVVENITVQPIPVTHTTNPYGGKTVLIG